MLKLLRVLPFLFALAACGGDDDDITVREIPQAPSVVRDTVSALAPADAGLVVQFSSADRLAEIANALGGTFGAPPQDPLVDMVGQMVDVSQVDRTKPIAITLAFDPQAPMPAPTFILPFADANAAAAAHQGGSAVEGDYAALSMAPELKAGGSTLADGLLGGDVSLRIDLKGLVKSHQAQIDESLNMAKGLMQQGMAQGGTPYDMSGFVDSYVGWARDFITSAETLDVAVNHNDSGRLDLDLAFTAAAGSKFDSSGEDKKSLKALARHLQGDYSAVVLMRFSWKTYLEMFGGMMDSIIATMPEEQRASFKAYFDKTGEWMENAGEEWAMAFDFGADGMSGVMACRADDPEALIAGYIDLMQSPVLKEMGFEIEDKGTVEISGAKARRMRFNIDFVEYFEKLGMSEDPNMPDMKQMQPMIDSLMGEDGMVFDMIAKDDTLLFVLDKTGTLAAKSLAADEMPANLRPALGRVKGDLSFLFHMDMRALMNGMVDLMRKVEPKAPAAQPGEPLPVTMVCASEGRVHRFGMSFEADKIAEFFKSMVPSGGMAPK